MKVDLNELAAAMAQSDVRQGYVDIARGKVILMQDDMGEEDALNHAFDIEEDWEHYLPLPNVIDECEHEMMQAFAASREREDVRERLEDILAGSGRGREVPPPGAPSFAAAGLGGLQARVSARSRTRLVRGEPHRVRSR